MLAPDTLLQNRYLIVSPIGKGGMGAVYLAKDQRLRSTVALKETFFEDERCAKPSSARPSYLPTCAIRRCLA